MADTHVGYPDSDLTDVNLDLDTDDVDDDLEEDDAEFQPPSKQEWLRTQAAIKKANNESKKHRLKLKEYIDNATSTGTGANEVELEKVRIESAEKESKKWKARTVREAAKAALLEVGVTSDPGKLVRLVDINLVDVDDEGEITGLDEQIEEIKDEYPELFGQKTQATSKARVDGAAKGGKGTSRKISSAERIAQATLGRKPARR